MITIAATLVAFIIIMFFVIGAGVLIAAHIAWYVKGAKAWRAQSKAKAAQYRANYDARVAAEAAAAAQAEKEGNE